MGRGGTLSRMHDRVTDQHRALAEVLINTFRPRLDVYAERLDDAEQVEKLNAWGYGPRVRVRPWLRDKKTAYVELHKDLDDAALVVTWSSASAITALYEGIPAISESGAAHALTGPLTSERVAQPLMPSLVERTRFLQILADNQFTLEEFKNGVAWRWLESNQ